ncbi:MAG: HPr family phosphocarrier protein [Bacteroidales bacterium]|nr:HPr family phosphocarrier protein [Bacteroidales bacterium]
MIAKKLTIGAPDGLHARPAGDLVKLVKSFPGTQVTMSTAVRSVNASSILSILSLALKKGTEVEIKAVGPDEEKALAEVTRFLESF